MLSNVIDVEEAMMHTALTEEEGAAIFFDFKAAFPSVLHEFLLGVLQHIGVPQPLMTFITALYQDNHCSLIIGGTRHQGFQLLSGIRQGCPLSPLCFAIAADLLLRRLQRLMPDALLRAYADGLSIIVKNGTSALPLLINIFNEYAIISGLQLNLPKTVYVPLHTTDLVTWSQEFQRLHPIWHDITIASKAKYLGFILGPGRDHDSYLKPIAKYIQRASDWNTVGCGLALSTMAYNVYILPVLLFVAQLDAPPTTWKQAEAKVLRKLLPGPAHWFKPGALRSISSLGFPKDFPDLMELTKAVQYRVATTEASATGGLDIMDRARTPHNSIIHSDYIGRTAIWKDGFDRSYILQLSNTITHCQDKGINQHSLEAELGHGSPRPYTAQMTKSIRRQWQRTIWTRIKPDHFPDLHEYMRSKLNRWSISVFPRRRTDRARLVYQTLRDMVPPRVLAAILRAHWNGWITARRLQRRTEARQNKCCFGCEAPGAIEHYASCTSVANFPRSHLRLSRADPPQLRLEDFLLLNFASPNLRKDTLFKQALRTACVYRAHNMWRYHPRVSPSAMRASLPQHLRELIRNHQTASQMVATIWTNTI